MAADTGVLHARAVRGAPARTCVRGAPRRGAGVPPRARRTATSPAPAQRQVPGSRPVTGRGGTHAPSVWPRPPGGRGRGGRGGVEQGGTAGTARGCHPSPRARPAPVQSRPPRATHCAGQPRRRPPHSSAHTPRTAWRARPGQWRRRRPPFGWVELLRSRGRAAGAPGGAAAGSTRARGAHGATPGLPAPSEGSSGGVAAFPWSGRPRAAGSARDGGPRSHPSPTPAPPQVADEFKKKYYDVLSNNPRLYSRFFKEDSSLTVALGDGAPPTATGPEVRARAEPACFAMPTGVFCSGRRQGAVQSSWQRQRAAAAATAATSPAPTRPPAQWH